MWKVDVLPRFIAFVKVLSEKSAVIPDSFLQSYFYDVKRCRHRNPIQKFLRYYTVIDILELLDRLTSKKRESCLRKVIRPYFQKWRELLDALDSFYDDTSVAGSLRAHFDTLAGDCGGLEHLGPDHRRMIKEGDRYKKCYDDFCSCLSGLPRKSNPNAQLLDKLSKLIDDGLRRTKKMAEGDVKRIAIGAASVAYDHIDDEGVPHRPKHPGGRPKRIVGVAAEILDEAVNSVPLGCNNLRDFASDFWCETKKWIKKWVDERGRHAKVSWFPAWRERGREGV